MTVADCWNTNVKPGDDVVTLQGIECVVQAILNLAIRFAGIALFVMLIIGGFRYLVSNGDPKETESAQKTISYAILGLVLLLGGWLILSFVNEFTGINVTIFEIPK